MNIREIKKVVNNLNSLVKKYDELQALVRFMERPENNDMYDKKYHENAVKRMNEREQTLFKTISFYSKLS